MANLKREYIDGFGWAMVDGVGNIWESAEEPEEADNYNEAERQAEWEFTHGYHFDNDRH